MSGIERTDARTAVRAEVGGALDVWRTKSMSPTVSRSPQI
jgi:hypothetical protein